MQSSFSSTASQPGSVQAGSGGAPPCRTSKAGSCTLLEFRFNLAKDIRTVGTSASNAIKACQRGALDWAQSAHIPRGRNRGGEIKGLRTRRQCQGRAGQPIRSPYPSTSSSSAVLRHFITLVSFSKMMTMVMSTLTQQQTNKQFTIIFGDGTQLDAF